MMSNTVGDEALHRADQLSLEEAILTAYANTRVHDQPAPDRIEVLPALHSYMSPDLVAHSNGQVMLVHEKPLPDLIWWADYDPEYEQLIFVTVTGKIIPLGVRIPPVIGGSLACGRDIALVEIDKDGKIINIQERKIVVRQSATHENKKKG